MPAVRRTLLWWLLASFGATILYATLGPEDWQFRLGLHWLVEHCLVFFGLTALVCLLWPRPMLGSGILLRVAVGLEAAQGLTPDREPDIGTALTAAAVAAAALLADAARAWRKSRKKA